MPELQKFAWMKLYCSVRANLCKSILKLLVSCGYAGCFTDPTNLDITIWFVHLGRVGEGRGLWRSGALDLVTACEPPQISPSMSASADASGKSWQMTVRNKYQWVWFPCKDQSIGGNRRPGESSAKTDWLPLMASALDPKLAAASSESVCTRLAT